MPSRPIDAPGREEPVAAARRGAELPGERAVAGSRSAHARLVDPADPVPVEEERHPGDVVLVRMGQDEDVDPAVPRRQPAIELDEQPVRIGAAVDEHPSAAAALDEDRVALADVEDRDPGGAVRSMGEGRGRGRQPPRPRRGSRAARPVDRFGSAAPWRDATGSGRRPMLGVARAGRAPARTPRRIRLARSPARRR